MKKKYLSILLILMLSISLVACGSNDTEEEKIEKDRLGVDNEELRKLKIEYEQAEEEVLNRTRRRKHEKREQAKLRLEVIPYMDISISEENFIKNRATQKV